MEELIEEISRRFNNSRSENNFSDIDIEDAVSIVRSVLTSSRNIEMKPLKDRVPPKGFVRIYDSEKDFNELVAIDNLDKRMKEIFEDPNGGENYYYDTLKSLWLRFDDATDERFMDRYSERN
jgi:hypothetical protein